jgi:hypothetical protein
MYDMARPNVIWLAFVALPKSLRLECSTRISGRTSARSHHFTLSVAVRLCNRRDATSGNPNTPEVRTPSESSRCSPRSPNDALGQRSNTPHTLPLHQEGLPPIGGQSFLTPGVALVDRDGLLAREARGVELELIVEAIVQSPGDPSPVGFRAVEGRSRHVHAELNLARGVRRLGLRGERRREREQDASGRNTTDQRHVRRSGWSPHNEYPMPIGVRTPSRVRC